MGRLARPVNAGTLLIRVSKAAARPSLRPRSSSHSGRPGPQASGSSRSPLSSLAAAARPSAGSRRSTARACGSERRPPGDRLRRPARRWPRPPGPGSPRNRRAGRPRCCRRSRACCRTSIRKPPGPACRSHPLSLVLSSPGRGAGRPGAFGPDRRDQVRGAGAGTRPVRLVKDLPTLRSRNPRYLTRGRRRSEGNSGPGPGGRGAIRALQSTASAPAGPTMIGLRSSSTSSGTSSATRATASMTVTSA
jgi:hypothetical protein